MHIVRIHQPGGPEALQLEDVAEPQPQAGEVRIKAMAIGVGRPDVLIRQGTYKWMPPLPATPGAELSGVIDAVGEGVTALQVGQRVLLSSRDLPQRGGCYVQSIVVPQHAPYRLPESISFHDAVSLPNLQLALALLQAASLNDSSEKRALLITGAAGGVAGMLSQLARVHGFQTIGTARSEDKRQFALANGFDVVLDANPDTLNAEVMQVTLGKGVNLAYDHLGGAYLPACIRSLSPLGTAISFNIITGQPSADVFGLMRELLGKSLGIRCFSMHTFDADEKNRRELMHQAIEWMAAGKVRAPSPMVMPLSEAVKAHLILDKGETFGKIVLSPQ
jgi:NADPH2:quinone reductase